MIRTRIIKEELYICIYCPHTWGYDQMGGYNVPEKIFYDEPYTNEETAEMLLTLAKKEHKKKSPSRICRRTNLGKILESIVRGEAI